jgi:transposase
MSYNNKFRERAVEYRLEGHTIAATGDIFKIGTTTLKKWVKDYKKTEDLSEKPSGRRVKKICPQKLGEYLRENPDAYQRDIAEVFGCSQSAVSQAMRKMKKQERTGIL